MRILFAIAERYPTHRADVMALFGKYLPRQGIQSDVFGLHDPSQPCPEWPGGRRMTVPSRRSRIGRHLHAMLNDLRLLGLARAGYDAVQVRDKAFCALVGLVAARLAGIPFFYWMSFPMGEAWVVFARDRGRSVGLLRWISAFFRGRLIQFILYRVVLPRADHVFVQSDKMLDNVANKGIARRSVTAVPMGADLESMSLTGEIDSPSEQSTPNFIYLGTLNRIRRPELMLEAVDIVRRSVPRVRLLLVGDAEEEADRIWLREIVARLGLEDHVQFKGWLPIAEAWSLARGCTAGLSPFPRTELLESASPTKAVEYFALGLPVIANDQPDQATVLAGAGARCVPLTPEGFAKGMLDAIEHRNAYREQARRGALWVRANRSYDVISREVAQTYSRLLAPPATERQ